MTDVINLMFEILANIKHAHLMTTKYAEHKATDKLYNQFSEQQDRFLEVYLGKYSRKKQSNTQLNYNLYNEDISSYLKTVVKKLDTVVNKKDDELKNIIEEMKASMYQTIYLLTLK